MCFSVSATLTLSPKLLMSSLGLVEYVNVDGGIVTGCFRDVKKFLKNEKLEKVVAIIKSSTSNALGDLTVTLKDLSDIIFDTIHYKVLTKERFEKAINVRASLILHNVSIFSPKQSTHHYFNITKKNMVKKSFPTLDNPELTIRRRSRADPTLMNDFKMAAEEPGDLPVPDLRTMEELCQPSLNDRGDEANKHLDKFLHVTQSIKVNGVTDDALHLYLFPHSLIHYATTWFDRLPRNSINTVEQMAKMFLEKYFLPSMVTKLRNEITNFRQHTFYNGLTFRHRGTINVAAGGTFMKRRPEECYDLIKNMIAHHNDWDTSAQRSESSSSITSSFDTKIVALKAEMAKINKNLIRVLQVNQQVKAVTPNCETCGGPHSFNNCSATIGQIRTYMLQEPTYVGNNQGRNQFFHGASQGQNPPPAYQAPSYQDPVYQALVYQALVHQPQIPQPHVLTTNEFTNFMKANDTILKNMQTNMTSLTNSNLELKNMFSQFIKMNIGSSSGSGTLPGNTITNPKEELKGITTRSGTAYQGPTSPTTSSSLPLVVERKTEATKDTMHPTNNESNKDIQPPVIQTESPILNFKPLVAPIIEPVAAPIGRALIDVFEGELTLHFGKEAITFNLDQTSRYSANYNDMTANQIDVIDMACEEYSQEVLGFSDVIVSGNPTLYYDPIVSTTSLTLTLFDESDFLLKEVDAFIALEDDPTSPKVDESYVNTEGDILLLEAFHNDDPSLPPPNQGNYLPQVRKELKIYEAKSNKSSIDEPPTVELKDLPPHVE
nr:reverse transcriptase domain-containing protein [Tanacetum cinerariifolium]